MKKAKSYLLVLFAVIFTFAAFMIIRELSRQRKDIDSFQSLSALVAPESVETLPPSPENGESVPVPEKPVILRNLAPLFERNSDCIGWLYIEGTKIDYPVMHTPKNPEQYLHRNFDNQYSAAGVPFADASCTLADDNLVIYGHNMKNGTMFADITKYRDKAYYTEHPTVELQTAQGLTQYAVFAVVQVRNDDSWYFFHTADDEAGYNNKVAEIKSRALYDTGITPTHGQQLITLSTCYGADKESRIIVIAYEQT